MVVHWKVFNNQFICYAFVSGSIKSIPQDIPIGIFDNSNTFIPTETFQLQNKKLHTWNLEIFLRLYFKTDIYFNDTTDYLVVKDINETGCGFLFNNKFDDILEELVLVNDPRKSKFSSIDGTYVYDNRIVIITNPNFDDIFKLSFYSKKLTISPFRLNREHSPYQLLKNYIFFKVPVAPHQPQEHTTSVSGGLIRFREPGFYKNLYEFDITAFYPNIIMKYLDKAEPIRILMEPLIHDSLKCLKLYIYGMLGSQYSILYNPHTMDTIASIGRTIIKKYVDRAVIVATDAVFMSYPIIPDFDGLPYKTHVHCNVFVVSASQYFTATKYKGFPKNVLSDLVHILLNNLLNGIQYETTTMALLGFMQSLKTFPLAPIPLKNGNLVTKQIKSIDPGSVDKFLYLVKYRKILYNVCQYKSKHNLEYDSFKTIYSYFMY